MALCTRSNGEQMAKCEQLLALSRNALACATATACFHPFTSLSYAVKEVNIRKLSPREREDAVNEIRILASIRHQNIVRCGFCLARDTSVNHDSPVRHRYCEAFVERDNLYIVMELAQHGDVGHK